MRKIGDNFSAETAIVEVSHKELVALSRIQEALTGRPLSDQSPLAVRPLEALAAFVQGAQAMVRELLGTSA